MPNRKCDQPTCRKTYFYQDKRSKYCSTKCRTRALRAARDNPPNPLLVDDPNDPVEILRQRRAAKRTGDQQAYDAAMARWNALPWSVRDPAGSHPDNPVNWL